VYYKLLSALILKSLTLLSFSWPVAQGVQDTKAQSAGVQDVRTTSANPFAAPTTFDWTLLRRDYEVGVPYNASSDVIAQFSVPCTADDLSFKIEWGDGNVEPLTVTPTPPFPLPAGSYNLRVTTAHKYATAQPRTVTITRNAGQCYGGHTFGAEARQFPVNVYARATVHAIDRNASYPSRSGRSTDFAVILDTPAPPSGTRVYLSSTAGAGVIDPSYPLAPFIDVPPGNNIASSNLRFKLAVPASTNVTIQAAAGSPKSTTFTVTP
jgi:hypothetical protein